jgi:hypothetical protein
MKSYTLNSEEYHSPEVNNSETQAPELVKFPAKGAMWTAVR